jgi:hypothetical protein
MKQMRVMMTKDEALKLALEALEGADNIDVDMQAAIVKCKEALAQPEERNFCPRCGKRTAFFDLTAIHTCTPPRENT